MPHFVRPSRSTVAAGVAALAACAWWFTDRAPYPYAQRRLLDLQLPFLGLAQLDAVLQPRAGERMLELGPGTGLQARHVAPQLGPHGRLDIVDVQQKMLDHVMRCAQQDRAEGDGAGAIVAHLADARELPFEEAEFDAVYLVTALGEIPQPDRALADAARVLKPGGRLVVGEFFDRHWIPFQRLHCMADAQGLHLLERRGPSIAYLAAFRPCAPQTARAGAA